MFLDKEQPGQGCNRENLTAGGSTNQFAAVTGEERSTLQWPTAQTLLQELLLLIPESTDRSPGEVQHNIPSTLP